MKLEENETSILLGEFLIQKSCITRIDLEKALTIQAQEGNKRMIGEILVSQGCLSASVLDAGLQEHRIRTRQFQESIAGVEDPNAREMSLAESPSFQKFYSSVVQDIRKHYLKKEYRTDLVLIDIQHYWLLALISYIKFLSSDARNNTLHVEIDLLMNEIIEYTKNHFNVEELLIKQMGDDFSEHKQEHREQHRKFIKQALVIQSQKDGSASVMDMTKRKYELNKVYSLLSNWWLEHIAIHDQNYALRLKRYRDKKNILLNWIKEVKQHNFLQVSKIQKKFFDDINSNEI